MHHSFDYTLRMRMLIMYVNEPSIYIAEVHCVGNSQ